MKLFLLNGCPFAHRATIVLQEKGLPFEPNFFERGKRPKELEAVSPYAKSPTLFDGEAVVWDASIVIEYLEDRYPERPLMPASAAERAEVRMLASRVSPELMSKAGVVAMELFYKPPPPDEAKIETAIREFMAALPAWNERLAGRSFLMGEALSLADVTLYTLFPGIKAQRGVEVPKELPHLRGWVERMDSRPTTPLLRPS